MPTNVVRRLVGDVRAVEVYLTLLACEIPFEISPSPSQPVPRSSPWSPPAALPSPRLRRLSRPRDTARRLAAGRSGEARRGALGGTPRRPPAPELAAQKCLLNFLSANSG